MAYLYNTDILDALFGNTTGGFAGLEGAEEPYATIMASNPDLFDEDTEVRILSTIEAIRSHMEILEDRDEARLLHFALSTMLEGFGSGGFIYGGTSENATTIVEGNIPNPVFAGGEELEIAELDGVSGGASIAASIFAAPAGDLVTWVAAFNAATVTDASGAVFVASRTPDGRLRIVQPVGTLPALHPPAAASGFVITQGEGANDGVLGVAGIGIQPPATVGVTQAGLNGGIYLPKVKQVANAARDRAVQVVLGQIREAALT